MKRRRALLIFKLACVAPLLCSCAPSVIARRMAPAAYPVASIHSIAVAPFTSESKDAQGVAGQLHDEVTHRLSSRRFFVIIEGMPEAVPITEWGGDKNPPWRSWARRRGVDAVLAGDIASAGVQTERSERRIEEEVGTGKYRTIVYYEDGKKKTKREEIKEVVIRVEAVVDKFARLDLDVKFLDVSKGELLAEEDIDDTEGAHAEGREQISKLPADGHMMDILVGRAAGRLADSLVPHAVDYNIKLVKNKMCKKGMKLAMRGDWEDALSEWLSAVAQDPANHAAQYDVGAALEVLGRYDEARGHYVKAAELKKKRRYEEALNRIGTLISDGMRLKEQMKGRK